VINQGNVTDYILQTLKGGKGSGFYGHAGRPGKKGGSAAQSGSVSMSEGAWTPTGGRALENKDPLLFVSYQYYSENTGEMPEAFDLTASKLEGLTKFNKILSQGLPVINPGDDPGEEDAFWRWAEASDNTRSLVKDGLVNDLSKLNGLPYDLNNKFVAQWMYTANDDTVASLSIQEAISEEFGVELSDWQKAKVLRGVEQGRLYRAGLDILSRADEMLYSDDYGDPDLHKAAFEELKKETSDLEDAISKSPYMTLYNKTSTGNVMFWNAVSDIKKNGFYLEGAVTISDRETERKYVRSVYENTQSYFSKLGYKPDDEITLFRGVKGIEKRAGINKSHIGKPISYKGNAAESWSVGYEAAKRFGSVFAMKVPVKNIWSTSRSGPGCLTEGEIIVLGNANATCTPIYINTSVGDDEE